MPKVILISFDDTIRPFTVETDSENQYDCFHSTVGVVLGNIAGENDGLENISAIFDNGTDIDTDEIELAAALFVLTDEQEPICTLTLIE